MNFKKLLCSVLAVVMLLSTMSISVFAAETTVSNEEALTTALAQGGTVVLGQGFEVTKEIQIPAGVKATLDLNGYALTSAYQEDSTEKHIYPLNNYGTLTIVDNSADKTGSITGRGIYNQDGATLTVTGAKIVAEDFSGGACIWGYGTGKVYVNDATFIGYSRVISSEGYVEINGGTYTCYSGVADDGTLLGNYSYNVKASNGLKITDGTFTSRHGVIAVGGGEAVIEGGSYTIEFAATTTSNVVYLYGNADLTINGGSFTSDNTSGKADSGAAVVVEGSDAKLTVNDGTYVGMNGMVSGNTNTVINGGSYETVWDYNHYDNIEPYVADGAVITVGGEPYAKFGGEEMNVVEITENVDNLPTDSEANVLFLASPGVTVTNGGVFSGNGLEGTVIYDGFTFELEGSWSSKYLRNTENNEDLSNIDVVLRNCAFTGCTNGAFILIHKTPLKSLTLENCSFDSTCASSSAIDVQYAKAFNMKDCYVKAPIGINFPWATENISIEKTQFVCTDEAVQLAMNMVESTATATATINDCVFDAPTGVKLHENLGTQQNGGEVGAIEIKNSYFTAEEAAAIENKTTLSVNAHDNQFAAAPVAVVDGMNYYSLQDAIDATEKNGTVTLVNDVVVSENVSIDKAITLDGDDHSVTLNANVSLLSTENLLTVSENVTFKDVTFIGITSPAVSVADGEDVIITLEGVTVVEGKNGNAAIAVPDTASVTLAGTGALTVKTNGVTTVSIADGAAPVLNIMGGTLRAKNANGITLNVVDANGNTIDTVTLSGDVSVTDSSDGLGENVAITFDFDGGKDENGNEKVTYSVDTLADVNAPTEFSKSGYIFMGWDKPVDDKASAPVTYKATWIAEADYEKLFTVGLKPVGGTAVSANAIKVDPSGSFIVEVSVNGDTSWNVAEIQLDYNSELFQWNKIGSSVEAVDENTLQFKVYGEDKVDGKVVKQLSFTAKNPETPSSYVGKFTVASATVDTGWAANTIDATPTTNENGTAEVYIYYTFDVALGDGLTGPATATTDADYVGTIVGYNDNYEYEMTGTSGNTDLTITFDENGKFTVPKKQIVGDMVIEVKKVGVKGITAADVELYEYVAGKYVLVLLNATPDRVYTYNGALMYATPHYDTVDGSKTHYGYLVKGTEFKAENNTLNTPANKAIALANLGLSTTATANLSLGDAEVGDVNNTGTLDVNDIQAVWNCYNVETGNDGAGINVNMPLYLRSDICGANAGDRDKKVDSADINAVVAMYDCERKNGTVTVTDAVLAKCGVEGKTYSITLTNADETTVELVKSTAVSAENDPTAEDHTFVEGIEGEGLNMKYIIKCSECGCVKETYTVSEMFPNLTLTAAGQLIGEAQISTREQLIFLNSLGKADKLACGEDTSLCYKLLADIDLAGYEWYPLPGGNGANKPTVFDGNGHTIKNLSAVQGVSGKSGLFGYAKASIIKNLTLENVTARGCQVGAFAGQIEGAKIENCTIKGNINIIWEQNTTSSYAETWGGAGAIIGIANAGSCTATDAGATITITNDNMTSQAPAADEDTIKYVYSVLDGDYADFIITK